METSKEKSLERSRRKKEHVETFAKYTFESRNGFEDIFLEHNALPEVDFNSLDTRRSFLGKTVDFPLMINAMTGGFDGAYTINKNLASMASKYKIPMAVGSQTIAVADQAYEESFRIVRKTIGSEGIVIGNVNGFVSLENMKKAVDMLEADALQIHLNPAQELCMKEGDRDFRHVLERIQEAQRSIPVPIIVKEVGFGISLPVARKLAQSGIKYIDIAGSGGTNFATIENDRNPENAYEEITKWGIPTALALMNIRKLALNQKMTIVCSGGMQKADQVIKALCLGADMVGMSGMVLRQFMQGGVSQLDQFFEHIIQASKRLMLLQGCENLEALKTVPIYVSGQMKDRLEAVKWR